MKIFANMTKIELQLNFRNIVFVVFTTIMPIMLLLLFGSIYGNGSNHIFEIGAVSESMPAYLVLSLSIIGITGIPLQLVGYKENKILKRLKATPIQKSHIFLPMLVSYLILFFVGMSIMLLLGKIIFNVTISGNIFEFIFATALSIAAIFSIGFLLFCLCNNIKQVSTIGFTLLIPMIFLSGSTMPIGAFPNAMANFSKFVPIYYCVEFMRNTFLGMPFIDSITSIIVLLSITLVCSALSIKFFRWE